MTDQMLALPGSARDKAGDSSSAVERVVHFLANSLAVSIALLALVLVGLPLAVWLDLRDLSEIRLRNEADGLAAVINTFRDYYANQVVARVLSHPGGTVAADNYEDIPGAIPIPARLSLELGTALSASISNNHMGYRFFSDFAFYTRAPHHFDDFELDALKRLRSKKEISVYEVAGSMLDRKVRLVTPIIMGAGCVECHNTHPYSPKRDWKIGDVRGIEEFTVSQPLVANIFAFRYLLGYFVLAAIIGISFIALQRHQASIIARTNAFLASIAEKLAASSAGPRMCASPPSARSSRSSSPMW